jgi:hypothetical protein
MTRDNDFTLVKLQSAQVINFASEMREPPYVRNSIKFTGRLGVTAAGIFTSSTRL